MSDLPTLQTLEERAKNAGLSVRQWLMRAGIAPSTYYRAQRSSGNRMIIATIQKLEAAIPSTSAKNKARR